jgi:hypothetical protein
MRLPQIKYERVFETLRDYYVQQGRKCRHAALHPSEAVEPDPPLLGSEAIRFLLGEEVGSAGATP